jgi:hypothetical protein
VIGGYRYAISANTTRPRARLDYGHIREVRLLTRRLAIDLAADGVSDALRHAMRPRIRMWNLDASGEEIDALAR